MESTGLRKQGWRSLHQSGKRQIAAKTRHILPLRNSEAKRESRQQAPANSMRQPPVAVLPDWEPEPTRVVRTSHKTMPCWPIRFHTLSSTQFLLFARAARRSVRAQILLLLTQPVNQWRLTDIRYPDLNRSVPCCPSLIRLVL